FVIWLLKPPQSQGQRMAAGDEESAPSRPRGSKLTTRPEHRVRVLHVTPDVSPTLGGTTTQMIEMCRAQARRGARVTVATTNLDEIGRWTPRYRPAVLLRHPQDIEGVEFRYFPVQWPTRFGFSSTLGRYLREHIADYDVVHVHRLYRF